MKSSNNLSNYVMIYTDGSCNVKLGLGGIGIYIEYKRGDRSLIGTTSYKEGFSQTTISRMELRAIIKALQIIKKKDLPTIIVSDSAYCVNSINKGWLDRWESENYFDRLNSDLFRVLQQERKLFSNLKFIHTRGHGKGLPVYEYGNNQADELACYSKFKKYTADEGDSRFNKIKNAQDRWDEECEDDLPF